MCRVLLLLTCSPIQFVVNVGAIAGGAVGGVVLIVLALCIVNFTYHCVKKKKRYGLTATEAFWMTCCCKKPQRHTVTTAIPMTYAQPVHVAAINETAVRQSSSQEVKRPPEYNPDYDPAPEAGYESYPATYTRPSPYPPMRGRTLRPTNPPAEDTLPPAYPTVDDKTLPPPYPAPGGTLPAGYPPQQVYPTQPPDLPPPYPY